MPIEGTYVREDLEDTLIALEKFERDLANPDCGPFERTEFYLIQAARSAREKFWRIFPNDEVDSLVLSDLEGRVRGTVEKILDEDREYDE